MSMTNYHNSYEYKTDIVSHKFTLGFPGIYTESKTNWSHCERHEENNSRYHTVENVLVNKGCVHSAIL